RLDAKSFEKIPGYTFLDGASEKIYQHPGLTELRIYAYGASRRMGVGAIAESSISQMTHDNVGSLFYEDGRLINAEEWLLQAYLAYKRSQEEPEQEIQAYTEKRYERVKELLVSLLEDVDDLRIKPITKTQLKAVVEAKTPYGWVDMKSLSLGYGTSIAWVVDLASRLWDRYPDSENPLEEPAIVLVDEIDLHLHPKWQRTIIRYLTETFTNTQFIVTAHSPLVVQAMPENANIVLLKREGNQVVIHNNQEQEAIYGWRLDQLVTSDLFDLPSARPPRFDELLRQREEILAKDRLNPADEKVLEKIGQQLSEIPIAETKEEHEAMSLIRKAS
ncbi:MAG: AAA family ATPase, partial [bacterium]|nr:AAA family ATPase [bacterium]